MKIKTTILFVFFLFLNNPAHAQKENYKWYFGQYAAMDFSTNPPTSLLNSGLASIEGSASISDSAGNLLFYTNGMEVFTKNHTLMQNGSGLNGFYSDSQPASIVRLPGSKNLYYIFYSSGVSIYKEGGYAIVDLSLNNGSGKVISKNVVFASHVAEGMLVVPHAETGKFWIVYNVFDSAMFQSFLFDCHGIHATRVVSNVGVPMQFALSVSNMSVSPDYKKFISTAIYFDDVRLMDFDNSTGMLSNPILIPLSFPFGSCFSPNSKVIYVNHTIWNQTTSMGTNTLLQYDISSNNSATILASKVTLDTIVSPLNGEFGQIQLAPDHNIYMARFASSIIPYINNPDVVGPGCGYVRNGFDFTPNSCNLGLPAIAYGSPEHTFPDVLNDDTVYCGNQISLTANYNTGPYLWNTGDTTQTIYVNQSGPYWVDSKVCITTFRDSINVLLQPGFSFQITESTAHGKCTHAQELTTTFTGDTYLWNTNDTTPTITVNQEGLYYLEITKDECRFTDSIHVDFKNETSFFIPNVFTPNGDKINDYFELKEDCFFVLEARVYNRWGKLVKETRNSNTIWDGKSNGLAASDGVYYYLMKLGNYSGNEFLVRGNVSLMN